MRLWRVEMGVLEGRGRASDGSPGKVVTRALIIAGADAMGDLDGSILCLTLVVDLLTVVGV